MKPHWTAIATLVFLGCLPTAMAQVSGETSKPRVSLVREPGGKQVLLVTYAWKAHLRPSIEVRLLGRGEPDDERVQPMYFRWKHMKGETTAAIYRCQDRCGDAPLRAAIAEKGDALEALGQRNSLGKPAVCIARWTNTEPKSQYEPGAAAVFPLLDAWSVDERLLYLDLPEDYFASPGALRVWMMRDDQVVWSEKVAWPGSGKTPPKAKPAPKAQPSGTGEKPSTGPAVKPPAVPGTKTKATPRPKTKPKAKQPAEEGTP